MKESPVFPGFDSAFDNSNFEIDPQIGFSQFLEEAKRFAEEKKQHPKQEEEKSFSTKQVTNEDKKCRKKSWKNAFLSFWKSSSNKKAANKQQQQLTKELPNDSSNHNYKKRSHVSGPIYGVVGAVAAASGGRQWNRRAASGPLAGLFNLKKDRENKGNEIPYVSLDKLNKPPYDAKTYGPVYLVS